VSGRVSPGRHSRSLLRLRKDYSNLFLMIPKHLIKTVLFDNKILEFISCIR
jgi:hypothetical protein